MFTELGYLIRAVNIPVPAVVEVVNAGVAVGAGVVTNPAPGAGNWAAIAAKLFTMAGFTKLQSNIVPSSAIELALISFDVIGLLAQTVSVVGASVKSTVSWRLRVTGITTVAELHCLSASGSVPGLSNRPKV